MKIIGYISKDKENPSTRVELTAATGLTDREVRNEIAKARQEGYIIINKQDGRGYYLSSDIDDIEHQFKLNNSRAMSILKQQKFLRRKLKAVGRL